MEIILNETDIHNILTNLMKERSSDLFDDEQGAGFFVVTDENGDTIRGTSIEFIYGKVE